VPQPLSPMCLSLSMLLSPLAPPPLHLPVQVREYGAQMPVDEAMLPSKLRKQLPLFLPFRAGLERILDLPREGSWGARWGWVGGKDLGLDGRELLCLFVAVVGCVVVRFVGGGGRGGVGFGGLGITWEVGGLRGLRGLRHCLVRVVAGAVLSKGGRLGVRGGGEMGETYSGQKMGMCGALHNVNLCWSS
jgi:hypothetical protein